MTSSIEIEGAVVDVLVAVQKHLAKLGATKNESFVFCVSEKTAFWEVIIRKAITSENMGTFGPPALVISVHKDTGQTEMMGVA